MEKRRKKEGKGRKTGEIKNRGRVGGDGKGEKAGASARYFTITVQILAR